MAGKEFVLLDLNDLNFQLDLLADISNEQLEELFNSIFSLAKKGEGANLYRIANRRAPRNTAAIHEPKMTFCDLFNSDFVQSLQENVPSLFDEPGEIALINSINASNGFSLKNYLMKMGSGTLSMPYEIKKSYLHNE